MESQTIKRWITKFQQLRFEIWESILLPLELVRLTRLSCWKWLDSVAIKFLQDMFSKFKSKKPQWCELLQLNVTDNQLLIASEKNFVYKFPDIIHWQNQDYWDSILDHKSDLSCYLRNFDSRKISRPGKIHQWYRW